MKLFKGLIEVNLGWLANIIELIVKEWSKARTVFTFMFYAAFIYLILKKIPVPPELNTIISTLFGFWFGQKQSVKKEEVK